MYNDVTIIGDDDSLRDLMTDFSFLYYYYLERGEDEIANITNMKKNKIRRALNAQYKINDDYGIGRNM